MALAVAFSLPACAGGLLTNTNTNIAFNRNFARDGVIAIDGVYSNPAGVAFLPKGFHLSLNIQNAYQTRTIESGMTVPSLQGTPFYQPMKMNGANDDNLKTYKGEASVPVLPSFQAALVYDKWSFQLGFSLIGGGGKCTFNDGLASFERPVAMIPAVLAQYAQDPQIQALGLQLGTATPGYSVDSYMKGQQYVFGTQLGVSYKVNEHLAVYGGFRFNYIYNKYQGSITNISANIGGENVNLYDYFGTQITQLSDKAASYSALAATTSDPQLKAQLEAAAAGFTKGAETLTGVQEQVADKHLDCTQNGWGITPIIGLDYRIGNLNIGTRLEFTNHLNIENNTKRDDTGLYGDGVNTPADLPGLFTLGAQYSILPSLRVMASWHYFFDKDAKMADDKQKLLTGNTQEYLAGVEWDINKYITVSAGGQRTHYALGNGSYLTDMSFVTSSYSCGFGAKFKIAKNASVNIAYFWTNYEHFDKSYSQDLSVAGQTISVDCTDRFHRTNRVLGAGIDIDL